MRTSRLRTLLAGLLLGVLAGLLVARLRRSRLSGTDSHAGEPAPEDGPRGPSASGQVPDIPVRVASRERSGTPADRGAAPAYGLDLEKLRESADLEPTVEYLTYVQSQRGDSTHLLFVRHNDLDAMAELEGQTVEGFLERLDQLGVVVSRN